MSARDEIAKAGFTITVEASTDPDDLTTFLTGTTISREARERAAAALLEFDTFADLIREAKREGWDEAASYHTARAVVQHCEYGSPWPANPYDKESD